MREKRVGASGDKVKGSTGVERRRESGEGMETQTK